MRKFMRPSKPSVPSSPSLTLVFPSSLPHLLSPMLPRSGPTEGVVPWLGALIVEFRSIMVWWCQLEKHLWSLKGLVGGGQTGDETLNCERVTCPYSGIGKREDNACGNICFRSITIQAHTYILCREREKGRERVCVHTFYYLVRYKMWLGL